MKHYEIRVSGVVQGVWFRKSTMEKALELGIHGMVKNMPDGSVYIEAEGNAAALSDFLKWCNKGPVSAKVDRIEVHEKQLKHYHDFQIIS